MGDIQPHAAIGRAAPFLDLGVCSESDPVTGGELHALRVVLRHEPFAETIAEDAAFTSSRFRDECSGGALGVQDAGWVELDEFSVAKLSTGIHRQSERIAGVLISP